MKFQLVSLPVPGLPTGIVLRVSGELDMRITQQFKEEFNAAFQSNTTHALLLIDDVSFIDSHNLGVFVGVYQRLHGRGGWVGVVCHQPYLRRVFDITNLDKLFRFFDSWEAFGEALLSGGVVPAGTLFPPLALPQPASAELGPT